MSTTQWIEVNRKNPCRRCEKPDWCARSQDQQFEICRRLNDGTAAVKTDVSGGEYYAYFIGPKAFQARSERTKVYKKLPEIKVELHIAPPEVLHAVYSALLNALGLNSSHNENLIKRGLNPSEIANGEYRSLPSWGTPAAIAPVFNKFPVSTLAQVPGFYFKDGRGNFAGMPGLLIPVRNKNGLVVGLRCRIDDATKSKYRWISSRKFGGPGPGSPIHVPLFKDTDLKRIRVTEGELKADIATNLSCMLTLSLPGVSCWRTIFPTLEELGAKIVVLAIDADARSNGFVARQLTEMASAIRAAGYAVEIEAWNSNFKGIDDALLAKTEILVDKGIEVSAVINKICSGTKKQDRRAITLENAKIFVNDAILKLDKDSGVVFLHEVIDALNLIQSKDSAEWARIQTRLGNKVSRRDLKIAMKLRSVATEPRSGPDHSSRDSFATTEKWDEGDISGRVPKYEVRHDCIFLNKRTMNGVIPTQLSNFAARIVSEELIDDGVMRETIFVIDGILENGVKLPRIRVSSEKFSQMGWPVELWGVRANVGAGLGTKDNLREAIQYVSKKVEFNHIHGHLGWIEADSEWAYLFAGGAITKDGISSKFTVNVNDPKLKDYAFQSILQGEDAITAIRSSFSTLDLAPSRLMYPILAATYCAPLGHILRIDFSLALYGSTGTGKTQIAALAQAHYGSGFSGKCLPGNWSSTANALEKQAYVAKDAVFTIDDFAPQQSQNEAAKLNQAAERIFRGAGNRSGRARLTSEMKGRPEYYPRGLVISTGEELPRTQSIRARILITEFKKGDVNFNLLTCAQKVASEGNLSASMAAYIQWIAANYNQLKLDIINRHRELRNEFTLLESHRRGPELAASLMVGFETFLKFALSKKALTEIEYDQHLGKCRQALEDSLRAQDDFQSNEDPTTRFIDLIGGALTSGRAHLSDSKTTGAPLNAEQYGWRVRGPVLAGHKTTPEESYEARGDHIGWVTGNEILLNPGATFAAAQKFAGDQNAAFAVSESTLWKQLAEKNLILKENGRNSIKRAIGETRRYVLVFQNKEIFWTGRSFVSVASIASTSEA